MSEESTDLVVAEANAIIITDGPTYERAANLFQLIGDMVKAIERDAKPHIDNLNRAIKELRAAMKEKIDPLEVLKSRLRILMANYDAVKAKEAREKQIEEERKAKEQADREALELAEQLEKAGLKREAEFVVSHPEEPAPVVVPKDVPKVADIKYVTRWHYEITDVNKLREGFKAGIVPGEALEPCSGFIHKQVTAFQDKLAWPGLRVWSTRLPQ